MELNLSWDLIGIVLFGTIIAYSFIVGVNRTAKIIIATCLASLTADGIGNFFQSIFLSSDKFNSALKFADINGPEEALILFKIIIFAIVVVMIATKGAFIVDAAQPSRPGGAVWLNLLFGFLSAGLIISTLLVYIAGLSFTQAPPVNSDIVSIYAQSPLVKLMVDHHDFWFSAPIIAFVIWSIFSERDEV